jgi:peptidoglycan/LPS O-acetylase OafA/YrhL
MIDFLIYSGYLFLLINLILYTYSFFHKEKANVFFICYLLFAFIMQITMEFMYHLKFDNLFVINIFVVGQMILLSLFYESILKLKVQKKIVKHSVCWALLILSVQFFIDYEQFLKFNLFAITITSLLIVAFALLHFYNMLTEHKTYYYITIAVIFFMLGSTILYLVGNLTLSLSNDVKYLSWTLNAFLFLIYQLFILYEWKISFSK